MKDCRCTTHLVPAFLSDDIMLVSILEYLAQIQTSYAIPSLQCKQKTNNSAKTNKYCHHNTNIVIATCCTQMSILHMR